MPGTSTRTSDRPRREVMPRTVPFATGVAVDDERPFGQRQHRTGTRLDEIAQGRGRGCRHRHEGLVPEEPGDLARGGPAPEVGRRGHLKEHPGGEDGHAVGHRERLVLVVRDEHGRRPRRDEHRAQVDREPLAERPVERGQGLVEQQQPRRGRERASQRDPLPLSAGQVATGRRSYPASPTSSSSSVTRAARPKDARP